MTFTDKKIEEFREKFLLDAEIDEFEGNAGVKWNMVKNWLRKALAEAEREGIRKELEREKYREKTEK